MNTYKVRDFTVISIYKVGDIILILTDRENEVERA